MPRRNPTSRRRQLERMRRRKQPLRTEPSAEQQLVARRAHIAGLAWIGLALLALANYSLRFTTIWPRVGDEALTIVGLVLGALLLRRASKLRRRPR
jgi:hypothetical protein